MVDFDSETLFNTAAAVVATLAALFFTLNAEYPYSPVSKTLLVVAFLAGVFALTQRTDDPQLTVLGYGVVVVTGIGLFFDLVNAFNAETMATVAGLFIIAAVLFALGTRLENEHLLSGRVATLLFGAVVALAVVVLVTDVVTGGLAYELQPTGPVEVQGDRHGEATVATVAVRNPTPFPERVETPHYRACTAGNWSQYRARPEPNEPKRPVRVNVHVESGYNEYVFGYASKQYPVVAHFDLVDADGESFPVEVTKSCPDDESGDPYIALFETEEGRYGRPV